MPATRNPTLPVADTLPLLGSAAGLVRDALGFLRAQHAKLGPAFELRVPGRNIVVLAGVQANRYFATEGRNLLSGERFWGGIAQHNQCPHFMLALEGEGHKKLRKHFAESLTQDAVQQFAGQLQAQLAEMLRAARFGSSLQGFARKLVSRQAHLLLTRGDAPVDDASLRALMENFRYQSNVLLLGKWPKATLKLPAHRAQQARVDALVDQLLVGTLDHDEGWFAAVHAGRETLPDLFTEGDMRFRMTLPFVLGVDTVGSTLAFMLRELMRAPELRVRIREAVDTAFDVNEGALPSLAALKAVPELRGLVLETLRLYPAAFGVYRHAAQELEFEGHRIAEGSEVLMFTTGAHVQSENFPNPYRFDVDRFAPPRQEHRKKHAFAPYGGGPHVCLGIGMGEALLTLSAALILRTTSVELESPERMYKAIYDPSLALDTRCRFRAQPREAHTI